MATKPQTYPQFKPKRLTKRHIKTKRNLEKQIDAQLKNIDNASLLYVTIKLDCYPPESRVLFAICDLYKRKGWGRICFNSKMDRFYPIDGYWTLTFEKEAHLIPNSKLFEWMLLRK